jgi:23S rRNA-/tRNA-specific pseudouridylate synthase
MSVPPRFWSNLPLGPGVAVLAHDANGLGALSKPAGLLSHPNRAGEEDRALVHAAYDTEAECFTWTPAATDGPASGGGGPVRLHLLNRLDSATSGLILVSADAALATAIRALFKRQKVRKVYLALVFGRAPHRVEQWRDRLEVSKSAGKIRTDRGGPLVSETQATVLREQLRSDLALTLLQLEPRTGRSHQLRVQCAGRHLPVVGDQTYGNFAANRTFLKAGGPQRMFLHSLETSFDYDWHDRPHHFGAKAPPPPEFTAAW